MKNLPQFSDLATALDGHVGVVEIRRPPFNFFDARLVDQMLQAFRALDSVSACRAIVLCAEGKAFCAGANFSPSGGGLDGAGAAAIYEGAVGLFQTVKPVVVSVHGPAVGGGLGVAMIGDFRVAGPRTRFHANFAQLGLHCGFGLSVTLPRQIGQAAANRMLLTGWKVDGAAALAIGLADRLAAEGKEREVAMEVAREIAACAPAAVQDMRASLRLGLADAVREATGRELGFQVQHMKTTDFAEGINASQERRKPIFRGG